MTEGGRESFCVNRENTGKCLLPLFTGKLSFATNFFAQPCGFPVILDKLLANAICHYLKLAIYRLTMRFYGDSEIVANCL